MTEVPTARLYAPALVLLAWALVWEAGCRGDGIVIIGWLLMVTAVAAHLHEIARRH